MTSRTITNSNYGPSLLDMGLANPSALITGYRLSNPPEFNDWWLHANAQLDAIEHLQINWDGEGSPAPSAPIVRAARGLLRCLYDSAVIAKPHIYPTRDGGVQFEWEQGPKYLEIELVAEGAASFYFCDESQQAEETGEIFVDEYLNDLVDLIRKVTDR